MTKEEFQKVLQRYTAGNCSEEERKQIDSWFAEIANDHLELEEVEKAKMNKRMLSTILYKLPITKKKQKLATLGSPLLKIAASLIITVLVLYAIVNRPSLSDPRSSMAINSPMNLVVHKNSTHAILQIQLPDSSRVELKPDSEISYAKKWEGQKREVNLIGEAFFEVVKDSKRPFYVYGGQIVTKVLGTSFSVNAVKGAESIEVSVRTGKVSVYEDDTHDAVGPRGVDASGVVLTPNEKVDFFVSDKHWVTSLVDEPKPLPLSKKSEEFVFSNTPMTEIINAMERTYAIDIILENETSYSCAFTGDVSKMELYDMLDVICKSTGTNYEVKGTKILVTGGTCQ